MHGDLIRSLVLITPEIVAALTASVALIGAMLMKRSRGNEAFYIGIIGMIGALAATVILYERLTLDTAFYGMIAVDPFSLFFRIIAYTSILYVPEVQGMRNAV